MNLRERQKGLLKLVDDYRDRECHRLLEAAMDQAEELKSQAFRKQRSHLHTRVLAERSRARERILGARAERATQKRLASEVRNLTLLQTAWPLLHERLAARWQIPEQRRLWADTYLRRALVLLPSGRWTVRHAPGWTDQERGAILSGLQDELGQVPRFRSEAGIEAGLIVESDGAVLDASLGGLLQDRTRLEARLLALIAEGEGG